MTPELWKKIPEAWDRYFDLPVADRPVFLEQLRDTDAELATELESLLIQRQVFSHIDLSAPPRQVLEQLAKSQPHDAPKTVATIYHVAKSAKPAVDEDNSTTPSVGESVHNDRVALPETEHSEELPKQAGRYLIQ